MSPARAASPQAVPLAGRLTRYAIARWHDRVTDAVVVVAMLGLASIVMAFVFEVIARYLLGAPTRWTADLLSYLLLFVTFTAMPAVTANGSHVAVTALQESLPPRAYRMSVAVIAGLGALVCGLLVQIAASETMRQAVTDVRMMAAYPIPKWWISVWIIYGFASSTLHFVRVALDPPSVPTKDL